MGGEQGVAHGEGGGEHISGSGDWRASCLIGSPPVDLAAREVVDRLVVSPGFPPGGGLSSVSSLSAGSLVNESVHIRDQSSAVDQAMPMSGSWFKSLQHRNISEG